MLSGVKRVLPSLVVAIGICAVAALHDGNVDAAQTDASTDASADGPPPTPGCRLDLAGGTYALMDCTVVYDHRKWWPSDSGVEWSPSIVITGGGTGAFPDVRLSFSVVGPPVVGPQWRGIVSGTIDKPPARWWLSTAFGLPSNGSCSMDLTHVKKIKVDGGTSYEMHGKFVCSMPEGTGVRGPDVVITGVF